MMEVVAADATHEISGFILYDPMKKFLSTSQIAKLEEVTPSTVQRWIRDGSFPNARKVGRVFRVPLDDYHQWREGTKVKPDKVRSTDRTEERTLDQLWVE